jgi:hypothetical protein
MRKSANRIPHTEKRDSMSKAKERQNKKIALINLGMSAEEAEEVLTADDEIDKGKKLFELSAEGKEAEKKYKNCGVRTVKSPYGQTIQKEKKTDNDKQKVINILTEAIEKWCGAVDVTNAEREFEFVYNDRKMKVTLSCPRK